MPEGTAYRPVDLPTLRDELLDFTTSEVARFWMNPELGLPLVVVDGLRHGGLFYVAEPMVDLCLAAKDTLPDFDADPEDTPAPAGLVYFAKPMAEDKPYESADGVITPGRIVGAAWRWIQGQWRQHWHPRRGVHRPLWIAPYVKGPEDAPVLGGEKVYAWTR